MANENLTFMNDAADFLLKNKRPTAAAEHDAINEGLLCIQAVRSSIYSNRELTAHLRAASIKNQHFAPAAAAYFEEMAAEYERLNQLERGLNQ